ncbi:MAG: glycosyltransferase family 4 protein, partial [Rudaea sp.]
PLVLVGRKTERSPRELPAGAQIVGSWPHAAVMAAWKRALAGILPSQVPETFGIAVLEAMSQRRAVIASRIGGLPDVVVDGESGLLVPPGDAQALRSALERLIRDRELRERLERAASDRAQLFSAAAVVPHIEEAYQMVRRAGTRSVSEPGAALNLTTHLKKPD